MPKSWGAVVVAFSVCWLPVVIILTLLNTGTMPNTMTMFYVRTASTVLFVSNSLINPVIYIWHMPGFQRYLRHLFRCDSRQNTVHPLASTTTTSIS
jgi:hypothetical protein